jgi:hypothetical protein
MSKRNAFVTPDRDRSNSTCVLSDVAHRVQFQHVTVERKPSKKRAQMNENGLIRQTTPNAVFPHVFVARIQRIRYVSFQCQARGVSAISTLFVLRVVCPLPTLRRSTNESKRTMTPGYTRARFRLINLRRHYCSYAPTWWTSVKAQVPSLERVVEGLLFYNE